MITCDAFIAEACGAASFGRRNFFGTNLGRRVLVPRFPYMLHAVFVVVVRAPAKTPLDDVRLTLTSTWGATFTYHVGSLPSLDHEQTHSIEWSKLDFLLPTAGSFTIDVSAAGFSAAITWSVKAGEGPLRQNQTSLPPSSLLDGRGAWNPLAHLAREVRESLLIADQYATPEFIRSLLPPPPHGWSCRVIVSRRTAVNHQEDWTALKNDIGRIEVRADDLIHDRFILRDDEEVYVFGHSLKDLDKGRISFFSRVYDEDQFRSIRDALAETWQRGIVVV